MLKHLPRTKARNLIGRLVLAAAGVIALAAGAGARAQGSAELLMVAAFDVHQAQCTTLAFSAAERVLIVSLAEHGGLDLSEPNHAMVLQQYTHHVAAAIPTQGLDLWCATVHTQLNAILNQISGH